jgi:hypothetical protein
MLQQSKYLTSLFLSALTTRDVEMVLIMHHVDGLSRIITKGKYPFIAIVRSVLKHSNIYHLESRNNL